MSTESEPRLKLTIWREYTPEFLLTSYPITAYDGDIKYNVPVGGENSTLSKEIYSITFREDMMGGIENKDLSTELNGMLRSLKSSDPPSTRSLGKLDKFISKANQILNSNEAVVSQISNQPESIDENPEMFNALLAFKLHLQWLLRCFSDHPKISVSVQ